MERDYQGNFVLTLRDKICLSTIMIVLVYIMILDFVLLFKLF